MLNGDGIGKLQGRRGSIVEITVARLPPPLRHSESLQGYVQHDWENWEERWQEASKEHIVVGASNTPPNPDNQAPDSDGALT